MKRFINIFLLATAIVIVTYSPSFAAMEVITGQAYIPYFEVYNKASYNKRFTYFRLLNVSNEVTVVNLILYDSNGAPIEYSSDFATYIYEGSCETPPDDYIDENAFISCDLNAGQSLIIRIGNGPIEKCVGTASVKWVGNDTGPDKRIIGNATVTVHQRDGIYLSTLSEQYFNGGRPF